MSGVVACDDPRRGRHVPEHHLGAAVGLGNAGSDVWPIQPLAMADFVRGIFRAAQRHADGGDDFIGLQHGLALVFALGRLEKLVRGDFARRRFDGRAEGNERRTEATGADEFGFAGVAKDGVVTVVAGGDERFAVLLREQAVAVAVIPAARSLAEVAADGAGGEQLRAGDVFHGGGQRGEMLLHAGVASQFAHGRHGADGERAFAGLDALEALDGLEADDALGGGEALLEAGDKVRAAGQNLGLAPLLGELLDGLIDRAGGGVFK